MNLQFDPSDIDECEQVKLLLNAGAMSAQLNEIYNLCRSQLKHGDCDNVEQLVATIEKIRELACEFS